MERTHFGFDDPVAGRCNERRWAMVKITRVASVGTVAALAACFVGMAPAARALTNSDKPAAILIWPKIVVDTSGAFGLPTDTLIQLSSSVTLATGLQKQAHCFFINGNSHCAANADSPGAVCQAGTSCSAGAGRASCDPGWSESDFDII